MRTWEDYKAHVKAQGKGEKENMNKLFQGGRAFLLWFLWFFWQRWPSPPHPFLFRKFFHRHHPPGRAVGRRAGRSRQGRLLFCSCRNLLRRFIDFSLLSQFKGPDLVIISALHPAFLLLSPGSPVLPPISAFWVTILICRLSGAIFR